MINRRFFVFKTKIPMPLLLIFIFISILNLPTVVFSNNQDPIKEPRGFRDIPWGARLSTLPPMRHIRNAERVYEGWTTYWIREGENINIGPIQCREIEYRAFFDLMYAVTFKIDESDCFLMSDIFTKAHGKKARFKTELDEEWFKDSIRFEWYWDFDKSYIRITQIISQKGNFGVVEIVNKDLKERAHDYMMKIVEEKKKLEVEAGINDLRK